MHYLAFVAIPTIGDVEKLVAEVMAPHQETYDDDTKESCGFWDWYQIGGRWTGHLSGYDPEADPKNKETCSCCHGSKRLADGPCSYCSGEGTRSAWPTQWILHAGDVQPISVLRDMSEDKQPHTIIDRTGAYEKEIWTGGGILKRKEWAADFAAWQERNADYRVVIVDFHS